MGKSKITCIARWNKNLQDGRLCSQIGILTFHSSYSYHIQVWLWLSWIGCKERNLKFLGDVGWHQRKIWWQVHSLLTVGYISSDKYIRRHFIKMLVIILRYSRSRINNVVCTTHSWSMTCHSLCPTLYQNKTILSSSNYGQIKYKNLMLDFHMLRYIAIHSA